MLGFVNAGFCIYLITTSCHLSYSIHSLPTDMYMDPIASWTAVVAPRCFLLCLQSKSYAIHGDATSSWLLRLQHLITLRRNNTASLTLFSSSRSCCTRRRKRTEIPFHIVASKDTSVFFLRPSVWMGVDDELSWRPFLFLISFRNSKFVLDKSLSTPSYAFNCKLTEASFFFLPPPLLAPGSSCWPLPTV